MLQRTTGNLRRRWRQRLSRCSSLEARTALAGCLCLLIVACTDLPRIGTPPIADIQAATEAKPKPTAAILTGPAADALYNSAVEGWGDRVRAAGVRLCRFYRDVGVKVECGG